MKKISLIIIITGFLLSIALSFLVHKQNHETASAEFFGHTERMTMLLREKMEANRQLLYDGVGLFKAKGSVSRSEWKQYIDATQMQKHFSGIQGIGYSAVVRPDDLQEHVKLIQSEGFLPYRIYPEGIRNFYTSIIYLEPFDARNQRAFGYDMFTEKIRQEAMIRAIESGEASLSGKVRLMQENGVDEQAGFLLYVPLYTKNMPLRTPKERWAAIKGFIYAPLRAKKLISQVLGSSLTDIRLRIYDGNTTNADSLLYDSAPNATMRDDFISKTILSVDGREWTMEYIALENFDRNFDAHGYLILLLSGFAISILLAGLFYSMAVTKDKAQSLAEKMTEELRHSREELTSNKRLLQTILDAIPHSVLLKNREGKFVYANQALADMYGSTPKEMIGKDDAYFTGDKEQADLFTKRIQETIQSGKTQIYFKDIKNLQTGEVRNYQSIKKPITMNSDGERYVLIVSNDMTEINRLHTMIEEERQRYKTIMELASDGVHILDRKGHLVEFSDSFAHMLGYTRNEMKELTILEWDATVPPEELMAKLNENISEPVTFETKHRRKEGTLRDVQIAARGLELNGQMYIYASARDITEQKRHRENLQNLLEQSPIAVRIAKKDGEEVVFANDAYVQLIESTRVLVIGNNPRNYYANQDDYDLIVSRIKQKEIIHNQLVELKINDNTVWALASYMPMEFDGEECLLGWFYNVNDLKQIQETLKEQKEEFETIFNISRDGLAVLDLESRFLDFNDAYLTITGLTREELLRTSCIELTIPEDRVRTKEAISITIEQGFFESLEKTCIVKDGQRRTVSMALSLMPDHRRIMISTKDITLLKKHEEKLAHIAHYDPLTGLPNRVLNADRLHQAMIQTHRRGGYIAVVYLDLDGFKGVNDTYGHDIGDQLLVMLSARMKEALREEDTISRIGGDEFVAILTGITEPSIEFTIIDRLLKAAAEAVHIGELMVQVTASIGVTFFPQSRDIDGDQLIRQADQAMYEAKQSGKNRYYVFDTQ